MKLVILTLFSVVVVAAVVVVVVAVWAFTTAGRPKIILRMTHANGIISIECLS